MILDEFADLVRAELVDHEINPDCVDAVVETAWQRYWHARDEFAGALARNRRVDDVAAIIAAWWAYDSPRRPLDPDRIYAWAKGWVE